MTAWIFSTEPDVYPWSRVEADGPSRWDGIRGPLARKYLRQIRPGDPIYGYHSTPEMAVVCLARAESDPYPDPAAPGWWAVDVRFDRWLDRRVPLADLRAAPDLARCPFLRVPRLSVSPLTAMEERTVRRLSLRSPRGGQARAKTRDRYHPLPDPPPSRGRGPKSEGIGEKTRRMDMLKVGDKAPAFSGADQNGKKITLAGLKGKTVVLYFYPRDMTPGCTVEACAFRDGTAAFKKKGAVVLGVSKDGVESHRKFAQKYELPFSLLADEDLKIMKAYGAWGPKTLYGKKFMGTLRITYIIGPDGRITAVFPKVKPAGHDKEVLAAIG